MVTQPGIANPRLADRTVNCFVMSLAGGHVSVPICYIACVWHNTVLALQGNILSFIVYLQTQLQLVVGCPWGQ